MPLKKPVSTAPTEQPTRHLKCRGYLPHGCYCVILRKGILTREHKDNCEKCTSFEAKDANTQK
jgi:hypothetical protein